MKVHKPKNSNTLIYILAKYYTKRRPLAFSPILKSSINCDMASLMHERKVISTTGNARNFLHQQNEILHQRHVSTKGSIYYYCYY